MFLRYFTNADKNTVTLLVIFPLVYVLIISTLYPCNENISERECILDAMPPVVKSTGPIISTLLTDLWFIKRKSKQS